MEVYVKLLTIRQAAREGIAPEFRLRQWVRSGQVRTIRAGNRNYVDGDTLPAQIEALFAKDGAETVAQ